MSVSIIMPVYNGEQFISEAIESIVNQTYTDWQLIVINDGSTDSTASIVLAWANKDNRILCIQNTNEKGLYGALNTGLAKASGEYIARFDADDISRLTRLAEQVQFLHTNPHIAVVGGYYESFGNRAPRIHKHPTSPVILEWKFLSNTYFCHPTIMFRQSVLEKVPEYPAVVCEDFAFFSKILKSYKGANMPQILISYREHSTNYSKTRRDSITQSVLQTFSENFLYYNGSPSNTDIFYQFHAHRQLSIRNVLLITCISIRIAKKILAKHTSLYSMFRLLWEIKKQIVVSVFFYYLKPLYRFLKPR